MTPKPLHQEPDRYAITGACEDADALLTAFEAVEVGQPFSAAEEPAARHVAALADAAAAVIFPAFVTATADTLTCFGFYEDNFERSQYGRRMAALHADCRGLQPGLEGFLRSGAVCARVGAAAARQGMSVVEMTVAADQAVADYQRAIAGQLIGVAGFEPSASIMAVIVPALRARLDACRQKHAEYIAVETARLERERRDAAAAIAAAEQGKRQALAAFFRQHSGSRFLVGGRTALGSALSKIAVGSGAYDTDGELVKATLDELQLAHDQAVAASAVGRT